MFPTEQKIPVFLNTKEDGDDSRVTTSIRLFLTKQTSAGTCIP